MISEESWLKHNKPNILHLFDKKSAYLSKLHSVPLDLEQKIQTDQVQKEDLVFRRYKALLIPLDCHINNEILSELIQYFLQHSSIQKVYEDEHKSLAFTKRSFPFKCISMQITVTKAPLCKPSLKPPIESPENNTHENAIKVLSLLFDTQEDAKQHSGNFSDILKQCKLSSILNSKQLGFVKENYGSFIKELAMKYFKENQMKEFMFKTKSL